MPRRPGLVAIPLAAAMVLAACSSDVTSTTSSSTSTSSTAPVPSATPQPARVDLTGVTVALEPVVAVDQPIAAAARSGFADVLYVAQRTGEVIVVTDGDAATTPAVDISDDVSTDGERGLLGITFSPDGAHLYLHYSDRAGNTALDEWTMGTGVADVDASSRRRVLSVDQPYSNHNGGELTFGPDGFLYLGLGDGGGSGDPANNGQRTDTLLGKILRIDPTPTATAPYQVPADNPFADGGGRPEIYVYGLRNPWRFSFDRATGDLWIGDVGQNQWEEVNRLPPGQQAGANLGWNTMEGRHPFEGTAPADAVGPVHEYSRQEGSSVTGGYVYRGQAHPELDGAYLFTDYVTSRLWALAPDGGGGYEFVDLEVDVPQQGVAGLAEDTAGELYVLSLTGGVIYRVVTS